jgi:hypothetical protein
MGVSLFFILSGFVLSLPYTGAWEACPASQAHMDGKLQMQCYQTTHSRRAPPLGGRRRNEDGGGYRFFETEASVEYPRRIGLRGPDTSRIGRRGNETPLNGVRSEMDNAGTLFVIIRAG